MESDIEELRIENEKTSKTQFKGCNIKSKTCDLMKKHCIIITGNNTCNVIIHNLYYSAVNNSKKCNKH